MTSVAYPKKPKSKKQKIRSFKEFLMVLPFILLVAVFAYYPLFGWAYAFCEYRPPAKPELAEPLTKWFTWMLDNPVRRSELIRVLKNTFAISGLALLFSWFPMFIAISLNEIRFKPFRKFVQTVTTLPNFISWVLVFAIAFNVFSTSGAVNQIGMKLGLIDPDMPIAFLKSSEHIWFKMWLWNTWKNAGWAAIMYIAAITGIDEEYMEAAKVDGANRLQIILHITIPSILPTYFVLVMLNISNFLSTGWEQFYVFQNSFNVNTIETLDLYIYNTGMNGGYSLSVAICIFKAFVSILLLFVSNKASKKIRGVGFI